MPEFKKKTFKKSISHILLSSLTGLLIFFIFLALANYLINYMDNSALSRSIWFLNNNIDIILVIFAVFLIVEIFGAIVFPFNMDLYFLK